jgi:hypothetical protein
MKRHLERSRNIVTIRRISQVVMVAIAMDAAAALAAEPTAQERVNGGIVGGTAGAATGAGAGWAWDKAAATRKSGMTAAQMKDAAGRKSWNSNYYKSMNPAEAAQHREAVAKAKKDLAKKQRRTAAAKAKRQAKAQSRMRALKKQNPVLADDLKKQRAQGQQFNKQRAQKLKHRKNLKALKKASGNTKVKTSSKLLKSKKTGAKLAKTGRKAAKTGRKLGRVAKGALGGGAAGMVAGAALGVKVPDAVDGVMFAGKLVTDPKNAPKRIAGVAKGGVKMAGTIATTVTDPGKMARNLGNSAKGIGRTISKTGAYKRVARTRTGRAIGKGTRTVGRNVSRGYKTLARTRTGRTVGKVTKTVDRYTFKAANKGVKKAGRTVSRAGKSAGRFLKKTFTKRKVVRSRANKRVSQPRRNKSNFLKRTFTKRKVVRSRTKKRKKPFRISLKRRR